MHLYTHFVIFLRVVKGFVFVISESLSGEEEGSTVYIIAFTGHTGSGANGRTH